MSEKYGNIVILVLCRRVIANLLAEALEKHAHMVVYAEYDYKNVKSTAMVRHPNIALVEIPERSGTPALDALAVCNEILEASPGCKIMLLCPENDKGSVNVCVKAKQQAQIDDFLFYDSTVDYLVSKLEAMITHE